MKTKRADYYFKNGFVYSSVSSRIDGVNYSVMLLGKEAKHFLKDYTKMQRDIQGKEFDQIEIFCDGKRAKTIFEKTQQM